MGDPSGIGPEIIAKALPQLKNLAQFIIIGDKWVFNQTTDQKFIDLKNVEHKKFRFGQVRSEYGRASIEYLDQALELLKNKEIDCLVTCPVSKEAVSLSGLKFNGHTEYLAKHTKTKDFVMMLLNDRLKISLITQHIPINKVSRAITRKKIISTVTLTYQALKKLFSINNPRIVVCGLNPHASDNGVIGSQENKTMKPVLKKFKYVTGPISADIAISLADKSKFDAVIVAYHDQALIPLKLTDKSSGVNLTLGLSFVRTSPLHGTAFDIAGTNSANPDSLIAAIKLAIKCTRSQKKV